MFNSHPTIHLYGGHFIDDLFPAILKKISEEISAMSDEDLLADDQIEFVQMLTTKYTIDIPIIQFDKAYVKSVEKQIPAERFPPEFAVFPGKSYPKEVIIYHIPYSGDIDVLTFKPNTFSTFSGYPMLIDRRENCFLIEIIDFYKNAEDIKRIYEEALITITRDYARLFESCVKFNSDLESSIARIIETRKEKLNERSKFLAILGVPVKSNKKTEASTVQAAKQNKINQDKKNYDVAISFAGEDRHIAEAIAKRLKELKYSVFYDKDEEANLWGKDLYEHLNEVYSKRAKFCLMIISKNYANKNWTNHERKAAQTRAFKQNKEYILPLRLDETEIPGLNETVGYVNYNKTGLEETINLIRKKIDE